MLKLAQQNNKDAKDELITHNLKFVYYIASKKLKDKNHDTDDLFSIGVIGLIKAIDTYDFKKSNFITYAYKCIYNEILMYIRKNKKHLRSQSLEQIIFDDDDNLKLLDLLASENNLSEDFTEKEQKEIICELIKRLPDKEKITITYHFGFFAMERKTQAEIAHMLNCSQSYVSRLLKQSINKIKNQLLELGVIEIKSATKSTNLIDFTI